MDTTTDLPPFDPELVTRVLAGQATLPERRTIERWAAECPANTQQWARLQTVWTAAQRRSSESHGESHTTDSPAIEALVQSVLGKISAQNSTHSFGRRGGRRHAPAFVPPSLQQGVRRGVWAVAATFVLGGALYLGTSTARTPSTPLQKYETQAGQLATVHLRDGTDVTLAPQTSLVLEPGFGTAHRRVRLTGLAYFAVASQAETPFMVQSGRVMTRVLGTQFTIRHYAQDRDVVVAVRSGRVMTGRQKPVVLTGNTLARITDSTEQVTADADLRQYMEWTNGRLVFTGVPAAEIADAIGHWYGLTFHFADSALGQHPLAGAFDNHDTQAEVLQDLQTLLGVQMTFNGNIVTLTQKRMPPTPRVRPGTPRDGMTTTNLEVGR